MATVSVRYIVHDVDDAIAFYTRHLGFTEVMHPAPAFAMLSRGDLRLVLSAPGGGPGGPLAGHTLQCVAALVSQSALIASIILGVAETIVLTMFGASWAPAISFALLLGVLAVRPQGLLGR